MSARLLPALGLALTLGACAAAERPAADSVASTPAPPATLPAPLDSAADSIARADSTALADSVADAARGPRPRPAIEPATPSRASTPPVHGRDSVIDMPIRTLPPRDTTRPPR